MSGDITKLLGQKFDVNSVDTEGGYTLLEAGDYIFQIDEAEMTVTKGGGNALVLKYSVATGPNEGAKHSDWLNLVHNNPKAVEIAYKTLAKVSKAIGIAELDDSSQLVGKRFKATVDVEKGEGTYIKDGVEYKNRDKNVIKKYSPVNSVAEAPAAAPAQKKMAWHK